MPETLENLDSLVPTSPPRVDELLRTPEILQDVVYLQRGPEDLSFQTPKLPVIEVGGLSDNDKTYIYSEYQYLLSIIDFLKSCINKANNLAENESDPEKKKILVLLKEEVENFLRNLSFIPMHIFEEIIDIYATMIVRILEQNKAVYFYEKKPRSERFMTIYALSSLVKKIKALNITQEQKNHLLGLIHYSPSYESGGGSYYSTPPNQSVESVVVIYMDDFIQTGNYFCSQRHGAEGVASEIKKLGGSKNVEIIGIYIAVNINALEKYKRDGDNVIYYYNFKGGVWGNALAGSWSALDYGYEMQLVEYSKKLGVPLPIGDRVEGRYNLERLSVNGNVNYFNTRFNRMYKDMCRIFCQQK